MGGAYGSQMQIAIMLYPGTTALDVVGPYEVLSRIPGAEVRFVGKETGPLLTDGSVLLLGVTHTLAETPAPDLVLVPGGMTTPTAMVDKEILGWLRSVHETATWMTSVCSGAVILAAAGLLKGQPATTHWIAMGGLRMMGAIPRPDERIVRTGKVVTAAGVSAGIDLGLWLVGEIAGRELAEAIQLTVEYDPQPPFDSGHMSKASEPVRKRAKQLLADRTDFKQTLVKPRIAWNRLIDFVRTGK
jgi:transcriptional regulator GlxA family with amidase domain